VQEALPRAAGHGAQIRTMPGTCQLATALTCKSEEKACLTISPTRVHRTEAESAFLSRMKCSTGLCQFFQFSFDFGCGVRLPVFSTLLN
jgi:hypothetical protein